MWSFEVLDYCYIAFYISLQICSYLLCIFSCSDVGCVFLKWMSGIPLQEYCNLFTRSSDDGQLGCFPFAALMKKTFLNIFVEFCLFVFLWIYILFFLGKYSGVELTGWYKVDFIRTCQTVLQSCIILHLHQLL